MSQLNIPINKGNYSMDTPEREALFEQNRGEGWEKEYQAYRSNWSEYPKKQYISEYPLLVDLELSSICNLKCPMCYTITDEFKHKVNTGLMDFNLFKKIIDEIGGKVPAIRLSLRGEPTLNPHFIDCIVYAKEKGIKEVSTLTNASTLNEKFIYDMIQAGIDWITISIDGIGETYEKIRYPLKFEDTLRKIKNIQKIKKEIGKRRPVIKVQSIWPAIRDNPEEFYNTFAPYTDLVAFNPLIDYLGKDEDIVYDEEFSCPQIYQRLVISSDGKVMMCSNDEENAHIIGNANHDSIHEIWNGETLNKIRKIQKQCEGFRQIELCRKCYLPRKMDDGEKTCVTNRVIIIRSYVNRRQNIGE